MEPGGWWSPGRALWGKVGSVEKGLWCVCACVCACSWDFEKSGEVGVWRAGRVESRTVLAV